MKTKSINFQFGVYNISIITLLLTMFSCLPWRSKKSVDYVSPRKPFLKSILLKIILATVKVIL